MDVQLFVAAMDRVTDIVEDFVLRMRGKMGAPISLESSEWLDTELRLFGQRCIEMQASEKLEAHVCHDCGVVEGQLHERACDCERCPFCGHQLISCGCSLEHFYPTYAAFGTPEQIAELHREEWERLLEAKGRVPHLVFPNLCVRCGVLWPEMFRVPDEEWEKYVPIRMREQMLCRSCFDWIKERVDGARQR